MLKDSWRLLDEGGAARVDGGPVKQRQHLISPVSEEQQLWLTDRHLSPTCSSEKWKELWAGLFWAPGDLCCYDI